MNTLSDVAVIYRRLKRGKRNRRRYCTILQSGLRLLVAYEPKASYKLWHHFCGICERNVPKIIPVEMGKAIVRALAYAKRGVLATRITHCTEFGGPHEYRNEV